MGSLDVRRVGGVCALLYTVAVIGFFALFASSDIAEAEEAAEFLPLLEDDKGLAVAVSVLLIIAPLLLAVAGLAFFDLFRDAGTLMWVAAFGFVGGGLSILYRGFAWLAMTVELAPAYVDADAEGKQTLAAVGDTLSTFTIGADMVGAVLAPGIGVLLFSLAILDGGRLARWVGWLGIAVAILGGWLTLLAPASEAIEAITLLGFVGFWVWMVMVGLAAVRGSGVETVP